jgi:3-oxoacyl-[acyl-carrier-protein] synthase III
MDAFWERLGAAGDPARYGEGRITMDGSKVFAFAILQVPKTVQRLLEKTGVALEQVDWFLFQMRHRCPEMTEPRCAECPALGACHQRTDLFQPVHRTSFY